VNARRLKLIVAVVAGVASSVWPGRADATVISFDSLTRPASDVLVIDGVTITPEQSGGPVGKVATVQGIGLGIAGLLSPGFVDRFDSFGGCSSTGPCGTSSGNDFGVSLSVNGRINSVTLRFYQTLDGPPKNADDSCCAFEWSYFARNGLAAAPVYELQRDTDPTLATLDFAALNTRFGGEFRPFSLDIGPHADFGQFPLQATYLQNHGFPAAMFTYGLSIVSLDFTPDPVPEASTIGLLGAGLLRLFRRRRRAARAPAGR